MLREVIQCECDGVITIDIIRVLTASFLSRSSGLLKGLIVEAGVAEETYELNVKWIYTDDPG